MVILGIQKKDYMSIRQHICKYIIDVIKKENNIDLTELISKIKLETATSQIIITDILKDLCNVKFIRIENNRVYPSTAINDPINFYG